MQYELIMRVGIDPKLEAGLFDVYDRDDKWKIISGEHGRIVFEWDLKDEYKFPKKEDIGEG